jgi:hypothetical protein
MSEPIPANHAMWSIISGELTNDLLREIRLGESSPAFRQLYRIIAQHPAVSPDSPTPFPSHTPQLFLPISLTYSSDGPSISTSDNPPISVSDDPVMSTSDHAATSVSNSPDMSTCVNPSTGDKRKRTKSSTRTCRRQGVHVPLKPRWTKKRKSDDGEDESPSAGRSINKTGRMLADGTQPAPDRAAASIVSMLSSVNSSGGLLALVKLVRDLISHTDEASNVFHEEDVTFEGTLKKCDLTVRNRAVRDFQSMIIYIRLACHMCRLSYAFS